MDDKQNHRDSTVRLSELVMPHGTPSESIDLVDYSYPVFCNKCKFPTVSGKYPFRGGFLERAINYENGDYLHVLGFGEDILWKAKTGERCCECEEPEIINGVTPYKGWMPVEDVIYLLKMQRQKIREQIENALSA